MPITLVDPPSLAAGAGTPTAIDRLGQQALNLDAYGDPLARHARPDAPAPTLGETWRARIGGSLVQSVFDAAWKTSAFDYRRDEAFNPYSFIKANPGLQDDPILGYLVERGQFDNTTSEAEFYHDYELGRRFLEDADTVHRAGTVNSLATFAGMMAGDPTNLIPLGFGATIIKSGGALARGAKFAALGAAAGAGFHRAEAILNPVSDSPGLADDLLAAGTTAALSGTLGMITTPAVLQGIGGYLPYSKMKQLRRGVEETMGPGAVSQFDPNVVRTNDDLARVGLADEIGQGLKSVHAALGEQPTPHRTISALHFPGDETAQALDHLRAKYDAAGVPLQIVDHPDQWFANLTHDVKSIIDDPGLSGEATVADLGGSALDAAASALTGRYANLASAMTPGGRLAQATLGRLQDVYRTLSGSAQTVTVGSARDPLGFQAGAAAENIKGVLDTLKERTIVDLRRLHAKARREGPIVYGQDNLGGWLGYNRFAAAVLDLLRREAAQAQGFPVTMPREVSPAVTQGAARVREYFHRIRDELEGVGMLEIGPRKLAAAENAARPDPAQIDAFRAVVESQKFYIPRAYNTPELISRPAEFIARLAEQFRRRDSRANGRHLQPDERAVIPEVAANLGQAELAAVQTGKPLIEADLPPPLRAAYRAELDAYYLRNAKAAHATLTEPKERHGLADAIAPENPTRRRVMAIDDSEMADFLEPDLERVLERYHHVIGGRVAVRRAVQLNPVWQGRTLANGRPIIEGADLIEYLRETARTLERFAAATDERAGRRAGDSGSMVPAMRRLAAKVERDIGIPLGMLEGRSPAGSDNGAYTAFSFFGRQLLRASFLNKLGGTLWAQLNDLTTIGMHMARDPRSTEALPRAILGLRGLPKKDLETLGLSLDGMARSRALVDIDALDTHAGFGEGAVRKATARIENGVARLADVQAQVTLLAPFTRMTKTIAGAMTIGKIDRLSRRLLRAEADIAAGMSRGAALHKAGLSHADAAWLNKLGINADGAHRWQMQTYRHGLQMDDTPIRDALTYGEHLASKENTKPNFDEWDVSNQADRDFRDRIMANVKGEIDRNMVVTPGAFDRPIINHRALGRIFNQFQAFALAFGNQRLRVMAQLPAKYQMGYAAMYLAMGAVSDAISNHLADRRSLADSAELWRKNPLAMMYGAFRRSGLDGWLGRPLSIAEALGIPFAPGNFLAGGEVGSSANRHISARAPLTLFGPVAADLDQSVRLAARIGSGDWDQKAAFQAWKLAPFQNLLWFRMLHKATGLPLVPEAIMPDRDQRRSVRP